MEFVKLKELVNYRKNFIEIKDNNKYMRCRVQLHRRGVKLRDKVSGSEIKTKKQRLCKARDFIVAEMDAKFGGYGMIPEFLEGAIVSSHYYLYELKSDKLLPMFLQVIIDSGILQDKIKAVGSTNYSRVSAKEVLEYEIPCPSLKIQNEIIHHYFKCKINATKLGTELTHQQTLLKKLRQQILQEAIEGKLTGQWRIENGELKIEPASELLKRIQTEKAQLIKDKKIKKQKPLPPIGEEEKPFALPEGWEWLKIEYFLEYKKRGMITGPFGTALQKSEHQSKGVPVFGIETIKNGLFTYKNKIFVTLEKADELSSFGAEEGDIIISRSGTIDEICVIPSDADAGLISTNLLRVSLVDELVDSKYFCYLFKGCVPVLEQLKELCSGSTRLFLNQKILKALIFPIPSLVEQKAIVTKVEKLLALCNQLESQITHNQTHAEQLMQAVLKEAFTANTAESKQEQPVAANAE